MPSPSIKRYLPSFSQRELQETQIRFLNFTGVIDTDTLEGHSTFPSVSTLVFVVFLAIQMKANVAAETGELCHSLGEGEVILTVGVTDKHLFR